MMSILTFVCLTGYAVEKQSNLYPWKAETQIFPRSYKL